MRGLDFYLAAATIIPVLLVVLVLEQRILRPASASEYFSDPLLARPAARFPPSRRKELARYVDAFVWLEYVTLVALLAFIIFAEVIALEVLASESAAGWQHWVVRLGIWLQLLWVFSSGQYLISEARADEPTAKGE